MSDFIEALNLITSHKIHELYARQDTEDPLVLRKKVRTENNAAYACGWVRWRCEGLAACGRGATGLRCAGRRDSPVLFFAIPESLYAIFNTTL